jgi:hypothetical protein
MGGAVPSLEQKSKRYSGPGQERCHCPDVIRMEIHITERVIDETVLSCRDDDQTRFKIPDCWQKIIGKYLPVAWI